DPIGHGSADNDLVEKIAFGLQKGQVSKLFAMPGQGIAVLRCDGRIPPDTTASFEKERDKLYKVLKDQKLAKMIPTVFAKLREEAKPLMLAPHGTVNPTVIRTREEEDRLMKEEQKPIVPLPMPMGGNR